MKERDLTTTARTTSTRTCLAAAGNIPQRVRKRRSQYASPTTKRLEVGGRQMGIGMETMGKAFALAGNGERFRNGGSSGE